MTGEDRELAEYQAARQRELAEHVAAIQYMTSRDHLERATRAYATGDKDTATVELLFAVAKDKR